MPRLLFNLFIVAFAALVGMGCGLTERERAVSATNDAIEAVEAAGEDVAERINQLPDGEVDAAALEPLVGALQTYMERMDALNAAIRELGTYYESLAPFLDATFRPAAETAASACQEALDALGDDASEQESVRRALTRIGLCLDRYATAVTRVSAEYGRVAGQSQD